MNFYEIDEAVFDTTPVYGTAGQAVNAAVPKTGATINLRDGGTTTARTAYDAPSGTVLSSLGTVNGRIQGPSGQHVFVAGETPVDIVVNLGQPNQFTLRWTPPQPGPAGPTGPAPDLSGYQQTAGKNAANGYPGLNSRATVPWAVLLGPYNAVADFGLSASNTGAQNVTAMNNAIAALPSTGGQIFVPRGSYDIATAVAVAKNGVQIVGEGIGATVFNYKGSSGYCFDISVSGNQVLKDFSIDGASATGTGGALRLQSAVTRAKFVRLRIANFTVPAAYTTELVGALDNTFRECGWSNNFVHLRMADNTALVSPATYPSNQNNFYGCTFEAAQWAAGAAVTVQDSEGNLFDGCLLQGNLGMVTLGIANTSAGNAPGRSNVIRGCWFEENGGPPGAGNGQVGSHGIHVSGFDATHLVEATVIRDCKFLSSNQDHPSSQIYLSNAKASLVTGCFSNLGGGNKAVEHGSGVTLTRLLANDFAGSVPGSNVTVWP